MKDYLLMSPSMPNGEIKLQYSNAGVLAGFSIAGEISAAQHRWLIEKLPKSLDELQLLCSSVKSLKLVPIETEITFEMFWNKYDEKKLSSKKRSEVKWNRMRKSEQIKAYNYINRYFLNIPGGVAKKYAETYLNAEQWNN